MSRVADYLPPLIKARMEERGLDIQRLARQIGIDRSALADNLRGDTKMSLHTALRLLKVLKFDTASVEYSLLKEIDKQFKKFRQTGRE